MFQYGTWYALSWDIVEPFTACVSLSDAIAGYFFWVWAKKPWDMNEVRSYFFERKLTKLLKRKNISMTKYNYLVETKQQIKKKLSMQNLVSAYKKEIMNKTNIIETEEYPKTELLSAWCKI